MLHLIGSLLMNKEVGGEILPGARGSYRPAHFRSLRRRKSVVFIGEDNIVVALQAPLTRTLAQ